ncbi:MAG TPA: hypothetical protein VF702_11380 [Allosphingosinicella sp.]|jgi:hypothetical protein
MDYRHICTAAMIAHHGLRTAHDAANRLSSDKDDLETKTDLLSMRQILFRHVMLEIANIADVARIARTLYKDHPELGEMHVELSNAFEFFKYIRNKYIGHLVPGLTAKTFEWLPQAYGTLGRNDASHQLVLSWFVLETAINTYTGPSSGHKIFESDTDLNYPPDRTRFLNFLGESALGSLKYSAQLIKVAAGYVDVPHLQRDWISLAMKAGETDFEHLAKKR